jgi:hypothetical protein
MRFNSVSTAVVCLGQAFLSNQTIPYSFLQRIRATVNTLQSLSFPTSATSIDAPLWNGIDGKLSMFSSPLIPSKGSEFFPSLNQEDYYLPSLYLILSGGDMKQNGVSEAKYMYSQIKSQLNMTNSVLLNLLEKNDIRVILEENSRNTLENILNCLEFIEKHDIRQIYLVTSDYHIFRSLLLAKLIWNQNNSNRTIIPIFAASEEGLPFFQKQVLHMISSSRNTSREVNLPLAFLSSRISHHIEANEAVVGTSCTSSSLGKVYRPLTCRPADISQWNLLERLDLEKKALLSMPDSFRKYPQLKDVVIPSSEIHNSIQAISEFNTTIINSYLHNANRMQ